MTLEYSLDRARYDALVQEAQRRIIPRSNGKWTLHGPVDPGMTLLELYAALLEQRSFFADQVGEPFGGALLALLGDAIHHAEVARTVIAFEPETPLLAPRGIHLRPDRASLARTFTTGAPVAIAPPTGVEIRTRGGMRTELRDGIALLPADGLAAASTISLRFSHALRVGQWTGVLLELDGRVAPEWSPDAAAVDSPATLRYGWISASGTQWFGRDELHDGTGGLRRSGILRIRVPSGWAQPAGGDHEYSLVIATDAATFTAPPRLLQVVPNAVIASNRHWRFDASFAAGVLVPTSGQLLQLPLDEGLPLEDRVRVLLTEIDGRAHRWRPTRDLGRHGSAERVFTVDREHGRLQFGDGIHGRAPYPAAGAVPRVAFEAGGGEVGNIGGLVRWSGRRGNSTFIGRNPVPAIGGRDPESLAEARARTAGERTRPTRAVTKQDHETIALQTRGVAIARAHAAIGADPTCPARRSPGIATVYVVPAVAARTEDDVRAGTAIAAPRVDAGALAAIRRELAATRLVSHVVYVETARYRPVRIEVMVASDPYDRRELRKRIAGELRCHLDPLLGGDGTGWRFGAPLMPSELVKIAQESVDASGDAGVVLQVRIAIDGGSFTDACTNVDVADHELVELQEVVVRVRTGGEP